MGSFLENNQIIAFAVPTAIAVLALLSMLYLLLVLRRYRHDQKIIMGEGQERDIIAHSRSMQQSVDGLAGDLSNLSGELRQTEKRLDDCLTHRSVIRYDAYNDLSGMQSTTMALLDAHFSGIIVNSIQSRDHARIYVKEVRLGDSKEKLSPEEIQVLKEAMGIKKQKPAVVSGGNADG
ncbi:MAG: DUF4446 family protein [Thermoleophilia bacterium]|nr:DUF4446 family protein [Thermoleophilia bacterium]